MADVDGCRYYPVSVIVISITSDVRYIYYEVEDASEAYVVVYPCRQAFSTKTSTGKAMTKRSQAGSSLASKHLNRGPPYLFSKVYIIPASHPVPCCCVSRLPATQSRAQPVGQHLQEHRLCLFT